jgi:hypothetical protein
MADLTPEQRAHACNAVSTKLNALGHWLALEDCQDIADAALDAALTARENDTPTPWSDPNADILGDFRDHVDDISGRKRP